MEKLRAYKFRAREIPKSTTEPRLEKIQEKQRRRRERVIRERVAELEASRKGFDGIESRYRQSVERWNKRTAEEARRQEEIRQANVFHAKPAPKTTGPSYAAIVREQEKKRKEIRERRKAALRKQSKMPRRMQIAFARDAAASAAYVARAAARVASRRSRAERSASISARASASSARQAASSLSAVALAAAASRAERSASVSARSSSISA